MCRLGIPRVIPVQSQSILCYRNVVLIESKYFETQKVFHHLQKQNKKLRGEMKSRFVKIPMHISMHFILGNGKDRINNI